jgi:hypothetical protein
MMKAVTLSLGVIGAYSLLFWVASMRFFDHWVDLWLVGCLGYAVLAIVVLRNLWRLAAAKIPNAWLRAPLQSALFAVLFSPTFMACGAVAPMPFPFIIASDLSSPGEACGPGTWFTPLVALYVVLPTWLVFTMSYELYLVWSRRHAL